MNTKFTPNFNEIGSARLGRGIGLGRIGDVSWELKTFCLKNIESIETGDTGGGREKRGE